MEKYRLELGIPIIKGRFHYGYPLAILATDDNYLEWFTSNFVQVFATTHVTTDSTFQEFDFYTPHSRHNHWIMNNPFLDTQAIGEDTIDNWETNIIEFLIYQLKNDQYIYMFVDDYYIPGTLSYKKKRDIHNILVYGFDRKEKSFNVAGLFNTKYQETTVSFDDFKLSYISKRDNIFFPLNIIYLISHKRDERFSFDIALLSQSLEGYLKSVDTRKIYRAVSTDEYHDKINCLFGLDTYQLFNEILVSLYSSKGSFDMRLINTFWEHKKTMLFRIAYMIEKKLVKNPNSEAYYKEYAAVEKSSNICRNLMLKYVYLLEINKTVDLGIIDKVISGLKEIKEREERILSELLVNL